MKTFFNILQTITNNKNKTYPDEPFKMFEPSDSFIYTDEIYHIIFLVNTIFNKETKSKYPDKNRRFSDAKFCSLNSILENTFYTNKLKEQLFTIFSTSQKCYFAFTRLSRIYKNKKYNTVASNDLMLNSLDINHKHTFTLIENKSKYLFALNDLVSIIETSITNSYNFFSDPLPPLNPYTKTPFTEATLYNIYFKLKESTRLMSTLFHLFFLDNFNIKDFSDNNEPIIREYFIKKYVYNSPYTILYSSVLDMLKSNIYTKKYIIHTDFPKDKLVDIFRPFLFYFFIINYYIENTTKIEKFEKILNIKLKHFYEYNKSFGRRYVKLTTHLGKIIKQEYHFNMNHINFNKISNEHMSMELFTHNDSTLTNNNIDSDELEINYEPHYGYIFNTDILIGELWRNI